MWCELYLMCTNEATGTANVPVLGEVPGCKRCADNLDLDLKPVE